MADDVELQKLRDIVDQLAARVSRLETTLGARAPSAAAPTPASRPVPPTSVRPPAPHFHLPPGPVGLAGRTTADHNLESRIGSQWFNRVGIVAVLVGISYFLKYAFENNWVGPMGRVSIGLLAGIAVVVWSEWFRRKGHQVFSYSLKAVGIGTMYLSLWAAFQVYHLLPASAAFAAMIVITAATATLALTQDAQVLAALALLGGFATPLLLSTGQNREVALFSYVALLDLGTLAVVIFRPWARLLAGAFVGTLALYIAWWLSFYDRSHLPTTIFFAFLFFAIFALAPLASFVNSGEGRRVPRLLLVLPLLNAAAFFLELYAMLEPVSKPALAWTAVALAAAYLALSRRVRSRAAVDSESAKILYLMHVALAVGFLTTAIPLKLASHWITIGWLVESAVLLWIGFRAAMHFLKALATVALVLGVVRLLVIDNFRPELVLLNARFMTYLIAIAAIGWGVWLVNKMGTDEERSFAAVGVIAINILAIVTLTREVNDYFSRAIAALHPGTSASIFGAQLWQLEIARNFGFSTLWMAYGAVLMWIGFWRRSAFLRWQAMALLILTVGKVFIYDVSRLERGYRIVSFIALGVLLLAISFVYQRDWLKLSRRTDAEAKGTSTPE